MIALYLYIYIAREQHLHNKMLQLSIVITFYRSVISATIVLSIACTLSTIVIANVIDIYYSIFILKEVNMQHK